MAYISSMNEKSLKLYEVFKEAAMALVNPLVWSINSGTCTWLYLILREPGLLSVIGTGLTFRSKSLNRRGVAGRIKGFFLFFNHFCNLFVTHNF